MLAKNIWKITKEIDLKMPVAQIQGTTTKSKDEEEIHPDHVKRTSAFGTDLHTKIHRT